mgnify:CR=1 FL=1
MPRCYKGQLDNLDKMILRVLAEVDTPLTAREIASKINIDVRKIVAKLRKLRNRGLIEVPEKGRYKITDEGRSIIK